MVSSGSVRGRWTVVAGVASAIVLLLIVPRSPAVPAPSLPIAGTDAWFHTIGYTGLAGFLSAALAVDPRFSAIRGSAAAVCSLSPRLLIAAVATVVAAGYGLGVEVLQIPISGRTFEVTDVLADGFGAVVGGGLWAIGTALRERG